MSGAGEFAYSLIAPGPHASLGKHAETYGRIIGSWIGEYEDRASALALASSAISEHQNHCVRIVAAMSEGRANEKPDIAARQNHIVFIQSHRIALRGVGKILTNQH